MKKQFRKLSLAVIFAMAVSMIAPAARVAEAATTKTFTYAEQQTGDTVTTLVMDKGEKVDLKFIGVSNWKTYTYKWVSNNTKVAVVDSAGMITALNEGVATIMLKVSGGDGTTKYTSTGVTVYVDSLDQEVSIGTSSQEEIKSYTIEMGKKVTLKANGIRDNVGNRYEFDWSSTDTSVATITDDGVLTPVAPGLSVIQLSVKKVFSGEVFEATPIALLVTGEGKAPVATATPAPTKKPGATATPTQKPTSTPTPVITTVPTATPAPTDQYIGYTVALESDNCMVLKFASPVVYNMSDIALYQLLPTTAGEVEVKWDILSVTLNKDGTELRIVPLNLFNDGEKYIIKAGSADPGKEFKIKLGAPNRLDVSYECLGTSNVAYAYDDELAIDVPVKLSYRLYYGNIDVTETYKNNGFINYDFASSSYEENVSLSGEELNFFEPNTSIVLNAVYTYFDANSNEKEVKDVVSIRSSKLPNYSIQNRVMNWTIIDTTKSDKIDWSNPVHQVISGMEDAKLVVMLADSYGNYYVNDERGVDVANNIYSMDDYDTLFSKFGYGVQFAAANNDQLILNDDGSLYAYQAVNNAVLLINLVDTGYDDDGRYSTRTIGVCQLKVLAEPKLSTVTAEESKVTLASQALPGFEDRFCEAEVEILLKDQYGNIWDGDYSLELTAKEKTVNNALSNSTASPARLEGTTLVINAENIKAATSSTSVTFYVTETTTNRKVTITAALVKPTLTNGEIKVTGWAVDVDTDIIKLGEMKQDQLTQTVIVEAFMTSNSGLRVGLYDDFYVIDEVNYKFSSSCKEGEVYVLVLGPDGKPVGETQDSDSLGVYIDEINNCIRINISAPAKAGNLSLESLAAGKYTIKATRIVEERSTTPRTASLTASFVVEDNTKTVTYRAVRNTKTSIDVHSNNDLYNVKKIIEELFIFDIDGKEWTEMTVDNIVNVEYVLNGSFVIVKSVEVAIPVESNNSYTMTYRKNVTDINKSIRFGVAE